MIEWQLCDKHIGIYTYRSICK